MKSNLLPSTAKGYWVVFAMWLAFQLFWYSLMGVHFNLEAEKYIREAQYVLQHHRLSEGRYLFYFSTVGVIALCKTVGLGLYGALLLIMAVNLLSYLYFFRALCFLFNGKVVGYGVIFLLLSFWPYQTWTLYLYTESFFYSAVLQLFARLILCRRLSWRFLVSLLFLLLLVVVSRPLGVLFVFPVLLFVFFRLSNKQKFVFALAAFVALLLFNAIVQTVFTTTSDWSLRKTIQEADIICDIPGPGKGAPLVLSNHPNQLYQLFFYITHNFSHFAELALTRLRYFFTMVRPYYSTFHNAYLIAYLAMIYCSIFIGIKKIGRTFPLSLRLFIISTITLFSLAIALQCDDYHNRFFLTLMPFWFTLSGIVVLPLIYRLPVLKYLLLKEKESQR